MVWAKIETHRTDGRCGGWGRGRGLTSFLAAKPVESSSNTPPFTRVSCAEPPQCVSVEIRDAGLNLIENGICDGMSVRKRREGCSAEHLAQYATKNPARPSVAGRVTPTPRRVA